MWRSVSDRPQEELAQFWLKATQESGPLGIYYLNMAISENRENLATLEFFFHKNHFHELHWLLSFCRQVTRILPNKNKNAVEN
jgi:hypothetical protein